MSDNDGGNDPGNVINFARRTGQTGFNLTPTTTLPGPVIPPPPSPDTTPTITLPRTTRRSPLDALNALPDPSLIAPPVPYNPPTAPGMVPDTFRSEPAPDMVGPRLGALSLAAILAVAVAALRGTATFLADRRQRRLERAGETDPIRQARLKHQLAMQQAGYDRQIAGMKHSAAMQGIGEKAAQQRSKQQGKVPSSSEFGRKTLGGRTNGAGAGGAKPAPKPVPKPVPKPNQAPNKPSPNGRGPAPKNTPLNHKKPNRPLDDKKKPPLPKAPHRNSQGANDTLKKHQTPGKDRTTLPQALKKHVNDAAQKRLEQRRNNDIKPVLRKNTPKQQDKTPVDLKKKPNGPANQNGTGNNNTAKKTPKQPNPGGLGPALKKGVQKAAARRWKKRQKRGQQNPPVWGTPKKPKPVNLKKKPKKGPGGAQAPGASKQQAKASRNRSRWARARAYVKNKAGAARGKQQNPQAAGAGQQPGPQTPGPGGQRNGRKSPFENAGQAAGATHTATSEHVPGSRAKRWEPDAVTTGTPALPSTGPAALDAAPTPHTKRPGTTRPRRPIPMPPAPARQDPRLVKARKQAARTGHNVTKQARHMDAQHETEITLDDAIDEYGDFKDDAFKTHDKCFKLAERARTLRDTLALFALELATRHNLIGALFTGAMARLSESMDLLARMADEMQTSSLEAAEMAEAADNDLNDAYRPYNVATADAGLSTPSAPIHNET